MSHIPDYDPETQELVIETSNPHHYRIIAALSRDAPSYTDAARRLVAAATRLKEFSAEAHARLPLAPLDVKARYTLGPGESSPGHNLDWSGTSLPAEIGPELSPVASEVIHHLRTAMEYIVFNLIWSDSNAKPSDWVKTPCFKTEEAWRKQLQLAPWRHLSPQSREALTAIQPFSGTTWLSDLTSLSNPDKHHSPIYVMPGIQWQMPREAVVNEWQKVPATPRLMVRLNDKQRDFIETAQAILTGIVDVVNPLLTTSGQPPIRITKATT